MIAVALRLYFFEGMSGETDRLRKYFRRWRDFCAQRFWTSKDAYWQYAYKNLFGKWATESTRLRDLPRYGENAQDRFLLLNSSQRHWGPLRHLSPLHAHRTLTSAALKQRSYTMSNEVLSIVLLLRARFSSVLVEAVLEQSEPKRIRKRRNEARHAEVFLIK